MMNQGPGPIAPSGTTCKCWWCEEEDVKNYFNDLCFSCTQYLATKLLPGVLGQGKYDMYRVYWDKLKTLVTEKKVAPSEQLLRAYMKSENKTAPAAEATNVNTTLQTLKRWTGEAKPACPPGRGNDAASQVSVAPSMKSRTSIFSKPPKSSAQSIRSRAMEKMISTTVGQRAPQQAAPKEDHTLTAFEKEFANLKAVGSNQTGRLAGVGAQVLGRFRIGSSQRASNPIFFAQEDKTKNNDSKRQGVIKGNAILLRQHLLRNPNLVTSINGMEKGASPSAGPIPARGRGGSVQVTQLKAQALLEGETKYSKFY